MKSTFKILLLTFALAVIFIRCEKENPEPDPKVEIPDNNFLNALIEQGIDTDGDGQVSQAEAASVRSLDLVGRAIRDISGIEYFVNLEYLDCSANYFSSLDVSNLTSLDTLDCSLSALTHFVVSDSLKYLDCGGSDLIPDLSNTIALEHLECPYCGLTSLDVSNNTALVTLMCQENQLTSLDVSHNLALRELTCYSNHLTTMDASNNPSLIFLDCSGNQLTSLNVSNSIALENLYCRNNQLTTIDVSNNSALKYLLCSSNQLTTLDVTNNTALEYFLCADNQLTTLDVTNLNNLDVLHCGNNQLTTLDISINSNLGWMASNYLVECYLEIENMPNLEEVCVWTMPFPPEGFKLCMDGSPNVYFTTECSK